MTPRTVLLLLAAAVLAAGDAGDGPGSWAAADWSAAGVVAVTVPPAAGERWLTADLVLADDRWFTTADPVRIPPQEGATVRLRLAAPAWAGDGVLGPDALAAVTGFRPQVRDARGAVTGLRLAWTRIPGEPARPDAVRTVDGARLDRGPWHEVRWRLLAADGGSVERGTVEVVDAAGRRRPAFLAQPGAVRDGRWRARGAAAWTLRLRPDETAPGPWTLAWRDGERRWDGAWAPPSVVRREPMLEAPALPLAPAQTAGSPGWRWAPEPVLAGAEGADPLALAPMFAWRTGWWSARGPGLSAHARAAAEDARLGGGTAEIDLLPAWLGDEQGTFRHGTSPWADPAGPVRLLGDAARVRSLAAHLREVVARTRATPGLAGWRFGLTAPVDPAGESALTALAGETAAWLAAVDGRPLRTVHPLLGRWQRTDRDATNGRQVWEGFTDGSGGWRGVFAPARVDGPGSDGSPALVLRGDPSLRAAAAVVELDAPLWNLDQIRADVRVDGDGIAGATWFAWMTDDGHRWFQRRVAWVAGSGRWTTLAIPMDDAWQGVGHDQPWRRDRLRRIRQFGLSAWAPAGAGQWTASIDRLRRFGWPVLDRAPQAELAVTTAAPERVAPWSPVRQVLAVAPEPFNPYDPESADVGCTVVGPDGRERFWPAAWVEPRRIETVAGREQVLPAGPGSWVWTFAPPLTGPWRIRPEARVRWRDRILAATGAWQVVEVTGSPTAPLPVRVSARDPAFFETVDGAFYYPVGINLRSPGDSRQNRLLDASGPPARWILPQGWRSEDAEAQGTAAYAHWFAAAHAAGMDWARVWMAPWWCGLEWRRDWPGFNSIGWYNQDAAARLDRICDLADQHGIRLQIELQNHGMTSPSQRSTGGRGVDSQWSDSPWNRRNGGPFEHPAEWFAEGKGWDGLVDRHRYVLARWGWRTGIAAWVLSSEMEFTGAWDREARGDGGRSPTTEAWVRRNLAWFAEHDPQQRPVSVHFSHPWAAEHIWRVPGLGFNNSNAYTAFQNAMGQLGGGDPDIVRACERYLVDHYPPWDLGRPTLIGEWGGHWSEDDPAVLRTEVLHGPWAQAVLPFAGNTGFWWWLWLDGEDQWRAFTGPARFARALDPRGRDLRPVQVRSQGGARGVASLGPTQFRAYGWRTGTGQARIQFRVQATSRWRTTIWSMDGIPGEARDLEAPANGWLTLDLGGADRVAFSADWLSGSATPAASPR